MLQIHDIRESRVYQEAMKEGAAIMRLATENKSVAEIAAILRVDVEVVRNVLEQRERDSPERERREPRARVDGSRHPVIPSFKSP